MDNGENKSIEQLFRETDALTYVNALKVQIAELKEQQSILEETAEYQAHAIDRMKKIMRRIDNQYRAIVRCTTEHKKVELVDIIEEEDELLKLMDAEEK